MFDPNDYPGTHRQHEDEIRADAARAWEREHECHRRDCEAAPDQTERCGVCEEHFCPLHLYDGLCAACFAVDEAADELIEMERKAA